METFWKYSRGQAASVVREKQSPFLGNDLSLEKVIYIYIYVQRHTHAHDNLQFYKHN